MKYPIIFGVLALVWGCTPTQTDQTEQNVFLIDVSDAITPEIDAFKKGGVGSPPEDIWQGQITRYGIISNTEYARIWKYELKSANQYTSNEPERRATVKNYRVELESLAHHDTLEYEGSLVWRPLFHELEYVSKTPDVSTTIYLCSDLLENNSWVNFYDPRTRRCLLSEPEKLRDLFRANMIALSETEHISVVLVHAPYMETDRNELYALIVEEIYKPLLTEIGISVSVRTKI